MTIRKAFAEHFSLHHLKHPKSTKSIKKGCAVIGRLLLLGKHYLQSLLGKDLTDLALALTGAKRLGIPNSSNSVKKVPEQVHLSTRDLSRGMMQKANITGMIW